MGPPNTYISWERIPGKNTYRCNLQESNKQQEDNVENQCNMVWENICQRRNVPSKFRDLFLNHNTTLPTLYTLIKTHKIPPDSNLNDLKFNDLKVRPIVSFSGSPTEKNWHSHIQYYNTSAEVSPHAYE